MTAPAGLPLEILIRDNLRTLIPSIITVANGYYFDWGSVDTTEPSLMTAGKPASLLYMEEELTNTPEADGGINADEYENVVDLEWRAQLNVPADKIVNGEYVAGYDPETEIKKCLHDMKRFIRAKNSYGPWREIRYRSSIVHRTADPARPRFLETHWAIFYSQSQTEPTTQY